MASDAIAVGASPAAEIGGRAFAPARRRAGVRPVTVLRGAIACMVIANLGRIPLGSSAGKDAPLLVNELALAVVLVLGAMAMLQARSFRVDGVALRALAFAGVGFASAVAASVRFHLSITQLAFGLAYLARWVAYFGVYLVVLNTARPDDGPRLWRTYEAASLAFAGFGIVQALFLPDFAQLVFPETGNGVRWDHQGHRLVSTILDPNFAGALVVVPLLVLLARLAYGAPVAKWKPTLLLAAALLTVSRSTMLALLVGAAVLVGARGLNRRLLRLGAVTLAVLVPFLPALVRFAASFNKFSIDASAVARTVSWLQALRVLADNPILGVGFNTYGYVQSAYGFDRAGNDAFTLDGGLLFIAVMTGVVGVVLYASMIATVVRRCRRAWRDATLPPEARGTALGVAAATLALVVHSVFVNSLLLPSIMESLWLLWGLVFLAARSREPGAAPA